ncbi:hypothetical protein P692DRAFT_20638702, partial [Suillus brevipes Sb2]
GGEDVILGMSWLKKENPHIDWTKEEVHLRKRKVSVEDTEEEDIFHDTQESLEDEWDPVEETLPNLLDTEDDETEETLAQEAPKPKKTFEELVPETFQMYKDIFGDVANGTLPPNRKFDHRIDL